MLRFLEIIFVWSRWWALLPTLNIWEYSSTSCSFLLSTCVNHMINAYRSPVKYHERIHQHPSTPISGLGKSFIIMGCWNVSGDFTTCDLRHPMQVPFFAWCVHCCERGWNYWVNEQIKCSSGRGVSPKRPACGLILSTGLWCLSAKNK